MKFIINSIVAYLAISLIGLFVLCVGKSFLGLFLLTDLMAVFFTANGDLNKYIGEDLWGYLLLLVSGKIIVSLVIAGAISGLQQGGKK